MAELTYREAVAAGIAQEMRRDPNVVFLGEDVAEAQHFLFPGDRDEVRNRSMLAALEGLIQRL